MLWGCLNTTCSQHIRQKGFALGKVPKISILIATDDHPPDLDRYLNAMISQTLPPEDYEVIIVDSSRTHDYGPAVAKCLSEKDKKLRFVYDAIEKGGRASAYNHGLPLCRAPIILFFGDDYIAAARTAQVHLEFHEANPNLNMAGVGSAILPNELRTRFSIWLEESGNLYGIPFSSDMMFVPEDFFYIGNTSVKRVFLDTVGQFDDRYPYHAWDDFELGLRLSKSGMKSVYLPKAMAEHVHSITLDERSRVMKQAGECAAIFERNYRSPHEWHSKLKISSPRYRMMAIWYLIAYAITRAEKYLYTYYELVLDRNFAAGYRHARNQSMGNTK